MIDTNEKSEVVSWSDATYDESNPYQPHVGEPPHPNPEAVTRVVRVLYRGQGQYTYYYNDGAGDFIAFIQGKPVVKG
jgi:hypothetical protein